MTEINWREVEDWFSMLPLREQMLFLERLHRRMREAAYPDVDPSEEERGFDEMAKDPAIQRELRLAAQAEAEAPAKEMA